MRTAYESILSFDLEWPRWLLHAYPIGKSFLFENLSIICHRFNIFRYISFFFYNGDNLDNLSIHLPFVVEYRWHFRLWLKKARRKKKRRTIRGLARKNPCCSVMHTVASPEHLRKPLPDWCRSSIHSKYRYRDARDRRNPSTFNIRTRGQQHATRWRFTFAIFTLR